MDMSKDVGYRIKRTRQELDWTQEDLAQRYGCSDAHISRIEAGKVGLSLDAIDKIASILGKSRDYFVSQSTVVPLSQTEALILGQLKEVEMRVDHLEAVQSTAARSVNVYDQPESRDKTNKLPDLRSKVVDQLYLSDSIWKKNLFALRVSDVNLDPLVCGGDIVLVDQDTERTDGKLVICSYKDKTGVLRFCQTKKDAWVEDNETRYNLENCDFYGVVIKVVRDL